MLGHELRNPLAAITNAGELTKLLEPADPTFHESLEIIRQQASLMKRLVDDLLDVSRITSGRVQLQKSLVDAGEIVARVAESNNLLFYVARPQAALDSRRRRTCCLEADPYRLEQILSNLLVNAAKYTDPGGEIWFSARREKGRRGVSRQGHRHRHRPRSAAERVRFVRAGQSLVAPRGRRLGNRPDDRPRPGRAARRPRLGESEGFGRGAEFCRFAAGGRRRAEVERRPSRRRASTRTTSAAADSGRRRSAGACRA